MSKYRVYLVEPNGNEYSAKDWVADSFEEVRDSFESLLGILYKEKINDTTYVGYTGSVYTFRPEQSTPDKPVAPRVTLNDLQTYAEKVLNNANIFEISTIYPGKFYIDAQGKYVLESLLSVEETEPGHFRTYNYKTGQEILDRDPESIKRAIRKIRAKYETAAPAPEPEPESEGQILYGLCYEESNDGPIDRLLFTSEAALREHGPYQGVDKNLIGIYTGYQYFIKQYRVSK